MRLTGQLRQSISDLFMRTIDLVLLEIRRFKTCSRAQLYRYFRAAKVVPLTRQRPALYPDDTAAKVLAHLGLSETAVHGRIASMPELKAERRKARRVAA